MKGSLYDILGVSPVASKKEIKHTFYRLSLLYHPDVSSSTEKSNVQKFHQISHAYSILSNDLERRQYDMENNFTTHKSTTTPSVTQTYKHHGRQRYKWEAHPGARRTRHHPGDLYYNRWTRWTQDTAKEASQQYETMYNDQKRDTSISRLRILAACFTITLYILFSHNNTK